MGKRDFVKNHIIICPNCGKEALDHMQECPFCKSKLTPKYNVSNIKLVKRIRLLLWIVLGALAITLIVLKVLNIV
jgi:predicted amidophosphoribosyltransferase